MKKGAVFGDSLQAQIGVLQQRLNWQEMALKMLGIMFCVDCGKPHFSKSDEGRHTFMLLTPQNGDSNDSLVVCMDDPTEARCFLHMVNKTQRNEGGQIERVKYRDLECDLAKWILDSRSFLPEHPYNGFVQSVMAGESIVDSDLLAFHLAYWCNAYGGDLARQSVRHLISMCGWDMSHAEHDALIQRCLTYAISSGFAVERHYLAVRHVARTF